VSWSGLQRLLPWLLATWFVVISAMRLLVIGAGGPGFDGRLYRSATVEWLAGGDPWQVVQGGVYFGAPPPSLLPMIPFALVPEPVGVGALLALSVVANVWAIRRLRLPLWWLAFPPLVDGIWNANPHVLVVPLIVAGLAPLATIVKIYAAVVPAVRLEIRTLGLTVAALVVTAPFLPWARYLAERQTISERLDRTAGGGLGVWAFDQPLLSIAVVVSLLALLVLVRRDRERAAWLAMPALWPWTQWYYSSFAVPALVPGTAVTVTAAAMVAAAILAVPLEGGPAIALVVVAFGPPLLDRILASRPAWRDARPHGTLPTPNP
jgi:hypothetical protein